MSESTTRAYARASYTLDLPGLAVHALDTLKAYASDLGGAIREIRAEQPRIQVGLLWRCHADHNVPDSVRIR